MGRVTTPQGALLDFAEGVKPPAADITQQWQNMQMPGIGEGNAFGDGMAPGSYLPSTPSPLMRPSSNPLQGGHLMGHMEGDPGMNNLHYAMEGLPPACMGHPYNAYDPSMHGYMQPFDPSCGYMWYMPAEQPPMCGFEGHMQSQPSHTPPTSPERMCGQGFREDHLQALSRSHAPEFGTPTPTAHEHGGYSVAADAGDFACEGSDLGAAPLIRFGSVDSPDCLGYSDLPKGRSQLPDDANFPPSPKSQLPCHSSSSSQAIEQAASTPPPQQTSCNTSHSAPAEEREASRVPAWRPHSLAAAEARLSAESRLSAAESREARLGRSADAAESRVGASGCGAAFVSTGEAITTVMLRNLPNKYTRDMLVDQLNVEFRGEFNFLYLPIDFKNRCNVGYCFINFRTVSACETFVSRFDGVDVATCLPGLNSRKVAQVTPARVQGRDENVRRLRASPVLNELVHHPEWMPILFDDNGEEIDFLPAEFPLPPARPRQRGAARLGKSGSARQS